jgi:hypothetical protein
MKQRKPNNKKPLSFDELAKQQMEAAKERLEQAKAINKKIDELLKQKLQPKQDKFPNAFDSLNQFYNEKMQELNNSLQQDKNLEELLNASGCNEWLKEMLLSRFAPKKPYVNPYLLREMPSSNLN